MVFVLATVLGGGDRSPWSGSVIFVWLWWLIGRRVRSFGYVERGDDLLVTSGILFNRLVIVPYGRMQLVDLVAGPIDRSMGLATVKLHTAAATTDAGIPGLTPELGRSAARPLGRPGRGAGRRDCDRSVRSPPASSRRPEAATEPRRTHPVTPLVHAARALPVALIVGIGLLGQLVSRFPVADRAPRPSLVSPCARDR